MGLNMAGPNPGKVNQYTLPDPRQELFFEYFLTRDSDTFSNAYQSALKAGYENSYAEQVMSRMPRWMSERVKDEELISIAEKNVKDLMLQDEDKKVKADMTKFSLKGLQKARWSERQEVTGENGKSIVEADNSEIKELAAQMKELIKQRYGA